MLRVTALPRPHAVSKASLVRSLQTAKQEIAASKCVMSCNFYNVGSDSDFHVDPNGEVSSLLSPFFANMGAIAGSTARPYREIDYEGS